MKNRDLYPVTVDSVVFGYAEGELKVALIERKEDPFKGKWAIPGGFMEGSETAEETAMRELKEETGLDKIYLEQFHVFSSHGRDPRGRTIAVAFFALIDSDQVRLAASADAAIAKWWSAYRIPELAFGQSEIYKKALQALRNAMKTRPLAFELLPKAFTLTQLQHLYEQVFDTKIDKRNFRRKLAKMEFICPTGKKQGEKHRPAMLYRYDPALYKKHYTENFF
jgi:ADP-ribose pyrophosphatase YjhB (NUDIX family)